MVVSIDELLRSEETIYVFGYGSLTWKPDFESDRQFVGYIKGYERRFWQGSVHHRGTIAKPGRVLTLAKVQQSAECWGLVFEVRGKEKIASCLDKLCLREQSLGHYEVSMVPVYTTERGSEASEASEGKQTVHAIVYRALPGNDLYMGESSDEEISFDIATSHGVCGHNLEYLLRLTDFLRDQAPDEEDPHVFGVERLVRQRLGLRNQTWHNLLQCTEFRRIVDGQTDDIALLCKDSSLNLTNNDKTKLLSNSDLKLESITVKEVNSSEDEETFSSSDDDEFCSSDEDFFDASSDDEKTIENVLSIFTISA